MKDKELMQKTYAAPLHEQLASVPENARLVIDDPDGMGTRFIPVGRLCREAAAALRERLAQPEQEPVAWMYVNMDGECEQIEYLENEPMPDDSSITPLYTAPPQRKPLTYPQIHELDWPEDVSFEDILLFVRAIEAAHGIGEKK